MGVTGLWTVVQPCARPIKIETLNKKRLAVDASIWIYQFLKAVRDKEGNSLRNSHVVGFFRRICKLLFIGIKPVFVFDGGAPALKRQTISSRKQRREGRREDAVRTAGKLLALQMQRRAEEEERKRKDAHQQIPNEEEELIPENMVYVEELQMTPQERQQNRKFKKKDAYHLPELDVSLAEMGGPNDPRIMSLEELQHYARQFDTGEDINVYDFSKIDFDSAFFISLPASDRYNILNAARLRSRLRMGYSKDQLDTMFPDRMAFSKFQIERVTERNDLTQRLMNLNGMNEDSIFGNSRIAGEKGREYVLVRNEGVEGGWALGVVSGKDEEQKNKPIDVEELGKPIVESDDLGSDEEDFEDVPIEGLNRLPKPPRRVSPSTTPAVRGLAKQRRVLYSSRKSGSSSRSGPAQRPKTRDPDSLFVADESDEDDWEDVNLGINRGLFEEGDGNVTEDEELQRAIELSMQTDEVPKDAEQDDDYQEVFEQSRVVDGNPFSRGSGLAIARMANNRAMKTTAQPFIESDSEDDGMDLQAALAESRKSKRKLGAIPPRSQSPATASQPSRSVPLTSQTAMSGGFSGPLPFEKLDLGSSLLGKKKIKNLQESNEGGFEKEDGPKKKDATPLPPWFTGDIELDLSAQKTLEQENRERDREALEEEFQFEKPARLRPRSGDEVVDLDAPEDQFRNVVVLESSDEETPQPDEKVTTEDTEVRMGDLADKVKAEPSQVLEQSPASAEPAIAREPSPMLVDPRVEESQDGEEEEEERDELEAMVEEPYEWDESDSDRRTEDPTHKTQPEKKQASVPAEQMDGRKSPSPDFAEALLAEAQATPTPPARSLEKSADVGIPASGLADQDAPFGVGPDDDDVYSDPEDEVLFQQLAQEAEEHARFASSLNNNSANVGSVDYEQELKQLRNQQKKDRRDADEVTQAMITECQQLLSLFGLPYITAPMEAEAQCAELVSLGLVDGIVTDDSDIFLFGGTRVYKNMFNQAKFVECYLASDLEAEFSLTRQRLISIAQLLGSDYTEGLPGVGPVTALEILSEFDDLEGFKQWWSNVQANKITKADDAGNPFRRKFRRNATKLFLAPSFPDHRVDEAYSNPQVDPDPSTFVWGVPDLEALRRFLMATIGWTQERTDEILVPVIRDINRREAEGTQSNITAFFDGGVGAGVFAPRRRDTGKSKRLESALGRIAKKAKTCLNGGTDTTGLRTRYDEAGGAEQVTSAGLDEPPQSLKPRARKRSKAVSQGSDSASETHSETQKKSRTKKSVPNRGHARTKTKA